MKYILMATDFSDFSTDVLEHAVYLAKELDAELCLLHVFEPPFFAPPGMSLSKALKWFQQIKIEEKKQFDALVEKTQKRGVKVRPLFKEGRASLVINQTAKEVQADLVVVGSHGRSGMARFVNGSVAELVARTSPSPVLIVGPKALLEKGEKEDLGGSGQGKESIPVESGAPQNMNPQ